MTVKGSDLIPPLCHKLLTRVRQRVYSVSNKVLRAATVSSSPFSPLRRVRLNRIYQFVNSSMRASRRGTTVYSR